MFIRNIKHVGIINLDLRQRKKGIIEKIIFMLVGLIRIKTIENRENKRKKEDKIALFIIANSFTKDKIGANVF